METRQRPVTRTISKTPSIPRLRWPVSERALWRRYDLTADTHHAETLIIATVLLPTLAIAQQYQQLPQPRIARRHDCCDRRRGVFRPGLAQCGGDGVRAWLLVRLGSSWHNALTSAV